jgi:hypothetical protein
MIEGIIGNTVVAVDWVSEEAQVDIALDLIDAMYSVCHFP